MLTAVTMLTLPQNFITKAPVMSITCTLVIIVPGLCAELFMEVCFRDAGCGIIEYELVLVRYNVVSNAFLVKFFRVGE